MLNYFPKYFTNRAIAMYFIALFVVFVVFFRYTMYWYIYLLGISEVVGFFYFSNILSKKWNRLSAKVFTKKIFAVGLTVRIIWVVVSYFFYILTTGTPFEFGAADSLAYHDSANWGALNFSQGNFNIPNIFAWLTVSDYGYPSYLSFIYLITGNSIIIVRLIKALLGVLTVMLVYKVASRNFGENIGRMSSIFVMLMPNLIYYCGLHLKEVEMVFFGVAFIERADYLLRSRNFNFINVFVPLLLAAVMFTFRTVFGITALFALLTSLLFSTKKILGFGQRFIITLWVIITVVFFVGGRISSEIEEVWSNRQSSQMESMEWRAQREGGNKFADRASVAIFAPMIFIIPIPTMVNIEIHQNQQLINGGNYDKEILVFFLIFALIWIVKNKKWRDFTLLGSFMIGYLGIIAMSPFAQSERFHQPVLPFILMFAAYGIANATNKTKKYFTAYLVVLFFIILAWNWFKLYGRGMV